jgi:hypothetical protein
MSYRAAEGEKQSARSFSTVVTVASLAFASASVPAGPVQIIPSQVTAQSDRTEEPKTPWQEFLAMAAETWETMRPSSNDKTLDYIREARSGVMYGHHTD